jgi:DNA repair protein RadC
MEFKLSLEMLNNVSEIDIVYKKKSNVKMSERPQVITSSDSAEILRHYWDKGKIGLLEEFKVLFLNRAHRVLQIMTLSSGGITGTVADPRIILAAAIKLGTCSMILAHNHPSGNLKPSLVDKELSKKVKLAAQIHDITVLDHIILTEEGYFSFTEEGLL